MKTWTISVVIITFNRSVELAECLHRLRFQTLIPLEILVVNNASEDDTQAMLEAKFPDVIVINAAHNLGIPGGRNLGYKAANGDICITLDDDAYFSAPDAIEKLRSYFEVMPDLVCVS